MKKSLTILIIIMLLISNIALAENEEIVPFKVGDIISNENISFTLLELKQVEQVQGDKVIKKISYEIEYELLNDAITEEMVLCHGLQGRQLDETMPPQSDELICLSMEREFISHDKYNYYMSWTMESDKFAPTALTIAVPLLEKTVQIKLSGE